MTTQYINETFEQAVEQLSFRKQLVFAYHLAKRLLPNYEVFAKEEEWGDKKILENALFFIKETIIKEKIYQEKLQEVIDSLLRVTPDTDDFGSVQSSLALDVCVLLLETLESMKNQDKQQLSSIASLSFNSLRMWIEDRDNTFDESHIDNDPLMQKEITFQRELINKLANIDEKEIFSLV
jgi:uncharacterized protein YjaG (DUF416 family)